MAQDKVLQAVIKLRDEMTQPLKGIRGEIDKLKTATGKSKKKLEEYHKGLQTVGKGAMVAGAAITASVGGAFVGATKSAIEFESAFAGVKKTVNASKAELANIEKGLKDLSTTMPQSASELSAIAESAGQLGIETKNILKFTETMAMLGDATNLASEEAATSFARFANIVGMSQNDFDKLGSTVVALGNNLATTESEITAMAMRLAGAGAQIGLSEAQILSFAGALSSVGIEAEAGGSAFSKVMSSMQLAVETSNDSLKDFAKVAGMSTKEFKKAFKTDATGAIMAFIEGLGDTERLGKSTTAMLSEMGIEEIRLTDALKRASNASDVFNNALDIGNKAWKENNALTNEASQRYGTTASQLAIMKNQINVAAIDIGNALLPVLRDGMEFVSNLANKFANLDPNIKKVVIAVGLITLGFGVLLTIGGTLLTFVSSCITTFAALSAAGITVGTVIAFIQTTMLPIIAVIAAVIAAVVALKWAWDNNFLGIRDLAADVMDFVKAKIESVKSTFESVKQKCAEFAESVKSAWQGIKDAIANNPIVGTVTKFVNNVAENTSSSSRVANKKGQKSAWGPKRVVGNDVPYRLHDGERVLTRSEADRYDRGQNTQGVNITINGLTVREEADITKIANKLVQKINQNKVVFGGAY